MAVAGYLVQKPSSLKLTPLNAITEINETKYAANFLDKLQAESRNINPMKSNKATISPRRFASPFKGSVFRRNKRDLSRTDLNLEL